MKTKTTTFLLLVFTFLFIFLLNSVSAAGTCSGDNPVVISCNQEECAED